MLNSAETMTGCSMHAKWLPDWECQSDLSVIIRRDGLLAFPA
jgi:hypothetical protein